MAIDTNLLLLLVVGLVSPSYIAKHKRLRLFSVTDFDLLQTVLRNFDTVVATPNALTESSNLLVYGVSEPLRSDSLIKLAELIHELEESYLPSVRLVEAREYAHLGLADIAWLETIDSRTVFLTIDNELYGAALGRGVEAQHFDHVRRFSGLKK